MYKILSIIIAFILPNFAFSEIAVKEVENAQNVKAWLVEEHAIPIISLEINFRGGTTLDPAGKEGVTNLMSALLEEGAGPLDRLAFTEKREELALQMGFDASRDYVSVSVQMLKENYLEAANLVRLALNKPRFDDAAFELIRDQMLSILMSDETDPSAIAGKLLNETVFQGHAYARPTKGTINTVKPLTRADLEAARQAALTKENLYVTAVGDITADEFRNLIDLIFSELPEKAPSRPEKFEPVFDGKTHLKTLDTAQTQILFVQPGLPRKDPDFLAAYVLAEIFSGGNFSSRLIDEVRVKRGLTYGISGGFAVFDLAPLYIGSVATANATVEETLDVIRKEWGRIAEEGITAEELETFKKYLTGAYPLRFDSNSKIANVLASMQISEMEPDYIAKRNDLVNALTLEEMNRVAKRLFQPENLTFILVGNPKLDGENIVIEE